MTYDAENRMSSVAGVSYIYDALGQRVAKMNGNTLTNAYLYDTAGRMVTELDGSFNPVRREVYAGGRHLATYQGPGALYTNPANQTLAPLVYAHPDWLGTERARSDSNGALCQTTTSQPFGDNQHTSGTCFLRPPPSPATSETQNPAWTTPPPGTMTETWEGSSAQTLAD